MTSWHKMGVLWIFWCHFCTLAVIKKCVGHLVSHQWFCSLNLKTTSIKATGRIVTKVFHTVCPPTTESDIQREDDHQP